VRRLESDYLEAVIRLRVARYSFVLLLFAAFAAGQYSALFCPIQHHSSSESTERSHTASHGHAQKTGHGVAANSHDEHEGPDGRCVMVVVCASALLSPMNRVDWQPFAQIVSDLPASEAALTDIELPVHTPPPRLLS